MFLAVSDFDAVCDLQAQAVKNSEAASKRHAAGLAMEEIASPDGDDPSDGEDVGDIAGGGVELEQPAMPQGVAANTPTVSTPTASTRNRKGKEKVGASGAVLMSLFLTRAYLRHLRILLVI